MPDDTKIDVGNVGAGNRRPARVRVRGYRRPVGIREEKILDPDFHRTSLEDLGDVLSWWKKKIL